MEMNTERREISVLLPLNNYFGHVFSSKEKKTQRKNKKKQTILLYYYYYYISSLVSNVFSTNNVMQFVMQFIQRKRQ